MLKDIYIDHNVWDFLYSRCIDLSVELPIDEFSLHLTREAEFEISLTPSDKRRYIEETIKRCHIDVRPYFGFFDDRYSTSEQRIGGFGKGYWASQAEIDFINSQNSKIGKRMKTKLYKNEADISLAARSLHSIVLTLDKKAGPLRDAYNQGGKVVFLNEFDSYNLPLKEYVLLAEHREDFAK